MSKYTIKFYLLDGRGEAEQVFTEEDYADEFLAWCKNNPNLISNATKESEQK